MSIRGKVQRECDRANEIRRVKYGQMDHRTYFQNIRGHLLMSGIPAVDVDLTADLICGYAAGREEMPTVVLTGRPELLHRLWERRRRGEVSGVMISGPEERTYHPMYRMSGQQFSRLCLAAGMELGYAGMDRILLYLSAIFRIVEASYPLSLPAVSVLLREDDDFIAWHALEKGLGDVTADSVRGNRESGLLARRIIERLEETFDHVAQRGSDTRYSFLSGVRGGPPVMAFYQVCGAQRLMNLYLKEELSALLHRTPKIRVVLDEAVFLNREDELLSFLFQGKRQERMELIAVSENARAMLPGMPLDFGNVCLFRHASSVETETLSGELFGHYPYRYPTCMTGRPPALFFTLKRDLRWNSASEQRLRIRAEDLRFCPRLFGLPGLQAAIKTSYNDNVYLVSEEEFLRQGLSL